MAILTRLDENTEAQNLRTIGCTTLGNNHHHKVRFMISKDPGSSEQKEYVGEYQGESLIAMYMVTEMEQEPHISMLVHELLHGGPFPNDELEDTLP